jgi:hypothetical protein
LNGIWTSVQRAASHSANIAEKKKCRNNHPFTVLAVEVALQFTLTRLPMKNYFPSIVKLVAVAACALSLGSCNRAEYAMLPKGNSYHGVTRVATPVPANPAAEAPATVPTQAVASEAVAVAPIASAAPAAEAKVAEAKVATPAASHKASYAAATTTATTAPKLNTFQRLALNKVTRKVEKAVQKASVRQHDDTASTARISGNLRTGLILLLVGLLVGIFNALIGTIIALIGVIFIVLWLLDSL